MPRPSSTSNGRRALVQALGDACVGQGPNLLQQATDDYSPIARLPATATITDVYIDGLVRNPSHPLITDVGKHLHDSSLLPRLGEAYGAALQAVLHPESGTTADGDTVLLCQLQAMHVRCAHMKTVIHCVISSRKMLT